MPIEAVLFALFAVFGLPILVVIVLAGMALRWSLTACVWAGMKLGGWTHEFSRGRDVAKIDRELASLEKQTKADTVSM